MIKQILLIASIPFVATSCVLISDSCVPYVEETPSNKTIACPYHKKYEKNIYLKMELENTPKVQPNPMPGTDETLANDIKNLAQSE